VCTRVAWAPHTGNRFGFSFARFGWLEMTPPAVLARALEPWPMPLRTLDALYLASIEFLRSHRQDVTLASYDSRIIAAAQSLSIPLFPLQ
jgi:hypothetical protein